MRRATHILLHLYWLTLEVSPPGETRRVRSVPQWIVLRLIRLYQMTFSRMLPADTCRFLPSCSHYGYEAIEKYGALRGGGMAVWRVLRCNPFSKGGYDPVP